MQLSIDPDHTAAQLRLVIKTNVDDPGGFVHVTVENERGVTLARHQVRWTAERDLMSLGHVARDIVNHFLWGEPESIGLVARVALEDHCPPLSRLRRRRPKEEAKAQGNGRPPLGGAQIYAGPGFGGKPAG